MKIKNNGGSFEACPEFSGRGICVDMTPLRKQQSQYGERDVFKGVFEVDAERDDGTPYCVWTKNFTPSLNEKSNFRKFVRGLLGRDLTKEEMADFDTESLIGKTAHLVVVHEHKDGETYANIAACTPDKSGEPMKASGKYVRVKDRPPREAGGYRRAEQPKAEDGGQRTADSAEYLATKIHVGRCKGLEVRDLSPEQVGALIQNWLPTAKANPKPLADDKRLIAALDAWQAAQVGAARKEDDVPY